MHMPKEKDMDLRIGADHEETEETTEDTEEPKDTEETTEETTDEAEDTEETTEEAEDTEETEDEPDPIATLTGMVESLAQSVAAIAERVSVLDGVSVDMGEGVTTAADVDGDGDVDEDDLDVLESRLDIEDFDLTI